MNTLKRRRPSSRMLVSLTSLTIIQVIHGFSPSHSVVKGLFPLLSKSRAWPSLAQKHSNDREGMHYSYPSPLLPDDEQMLLKHVVQYRTIRAFQKELHLRTPQKEMRRSAALTEFGYDTLEELESALEAGSEARETLITSNLRLVHHVAQKIVKKRSLKTLAYEDLIQEGCIGLSRALDGYDPDKGTRFSTYAYYWIRASILRSLAEKNELVRIPEHIAHTLSKLASAMHINQSQLLNNDWIQQWAWKEANEAKMLAESIGEKRETVDLAVETELRRRTGMVVSMDLDYDGLIQSKSVGKFRDPHAGNALAILENNFKKDEIFATIKKFVKPKEAEALGLRYGLVKRDYEAEAEHDIFGPDGILANSSDQRSIGRTTHEFRQPALGRWGEAMSFKEVGKQMAISAEYGRLLCGKGLEKLRIAVNEGKLDPALLY